ncbi:toxin glutamine deamidase domain-containing protein, partial [Actinocatenispora thailandica]
MGGSYGANDYLFDPILEFFREVEEWVPGVLGDVLRWLIEIPAGSEHGLADVGDSRTKAGDTLMNALQDQSVPAATIYEKYVGDGAPAAFAGRDGDLRDQLQSIAQQQYDKAKIAYNTSSSMEMSKFMAATDLYMLGQAIYAAIMTAVSLPPFGGLLSIGEVGGAMAAAEAGIKKALAEFLEKILGEDAVKKISEQGLKKAVTNPSVLGHLATAPIKVIPTLGKEAVEHAPDLYKFGKNAVKDLGPKIKSSVPKIVDHMPSKGDIGHYIANGARKSGDALKYAARHPIETVGRGARAGGREVWDGVKATGRGLGRGAKTAWGGAKSAGRFAWDSRGGLKPSNLAARHAANHAAERYASRTAAREALNAGKGFKEAMRASVREQAENAAARSAARTEARNAFLKEYGERGLAGKAGMLGKEFGKDALMKGKNFAAFTLKTQGVVDAYQVATGHISVGDGLKNLWNQESGALVTGVLGAPLSFGRQGMLPEISGMVGGTVAFDAASAYSFKDHQFHWVDEQGHEKSGGFGAFWGQEKHNAVHAAAYGAMGGAQHMRLKAEEFTAQQDLATDRPTTAFTSRTGSPDVRTPESRTTAPEATRTSTQGSGSQVRGDGGGPRTRSSTQESNGPSQRERTRSGEPSESRGSESGDNGSREAPERRTVVRPRQPEPATGRQDPSQGSSAENPTHRVAQRPEQAAGDPQHAGGGPGRGSEAPDQPRQHEQGTNQPHEAGQGDSQRGDDGRPHEGQSGDDGRQGDNQQGDGRQGDGQSGDHRQGDDQRQPDGQQGDGTRHGDQQTEHRSSEDRTQRRIRLGSADPDAHTQHRTLGEDLDLLDRGLANRKELVDVDMAEVVRHAAAGEAAPTVRVGGRLHEVPELTRLRDTLVEHFTVEGPHGERVPMGDDAAIREHLRELQDQVRAELNEVRTADPATHSTEQTRDAAGFPTESTDRRPSYQSHPTDGNRYSRSDLDAQPDPSRATDREAARDESQKFADDVLTEHTRRWLLDPSGETVGAQPTRGATLVAPEGVFHSTGWEGRTGEAPEPGVAPSVHDVVQELTYTPPAEVAEVQRRGAELRDATAELDLTNSRYEAVNEGIRGLEDRIAAKHQEIADLRAEKQRTIGRGYDGQRIRAANEAYDARIRQAGEDLRAMQDEHRVRARQDLARAARDRAIATVRHENAERQYARAEKRADRRHAPDGLLRHLPSNASQAEIAVMSDYARHVERQIDPATVVADEARYGQEDFQRQALGDDYAAVRADAQRDAGGDPAGVRERMADATREAHQRRVLGDGYDSLRAKAEQGGRDAATVEDRMARHTHVAEKLADVRVHAYEIGGDRHGEISHPDPVTERSLERAGIDHDRLADVLDGALLADPEHPNRIVLGRAGSELREFGEQVPDHPDHLVIVAERGPNGLRFDGRDLSHAELVKVLRDVGLPRPDQRIVLVTSDGGSVARDLAREFRTEVYALPEHATLAGDGTFGVERRAGGEEVPAGDGWRLHEPYGTSTEADLHREYQDARAEAHERGWEGYEQRETRHEPSQRPDRDQRPIRLAGNGQSDLHRDLSEEGTGRLKTLSNARIIDRVVGDLGLDRHRPLRLDEQRVAEILKTEVDERDDPARRRLQQIVEQEFTHLDADGNRTPNSTTEIRQRIAELRAEARQEYADARAAGDTRAGTPEYGDRLEQVGGSGGEGHGYTRSEPPSRHRDPNSPADRADARARAVKFADDVLYADLRAFAEHPDDPPARPSMATVIMSPDGTLHFSTSRTGVAGDGVPAGTHPLIAADYHLVEHQLTGHGNGEAEFWVGDANHGGSPVWFKEWSQRNPELAELAKQHDAALDRRQGVLDSLRKLPASAPEQARTRLTELATQRETEAGQIDRALQEKAAEQGKQQELADYKRFKSLYDAERPDEAGRRQEWLNRRLEIAERYTPGRGHGRCSEVSGLSDHAKRLDREYDQLGRRDAARVEHAKESVQRRNLGELYDRLKGSGATDQELARHSYVAERLREISITAHQIGGTFQVEHGEYRAPCTSCEHAERNLGIVPDHLREIADRVALGEPNKLVLAEPGTDLARYAANIPRHPDAFVLVAHGEPNALTFDGYRLNPREVHDLLVQAGWRPDQRIVLLGCRGGEVRYDWPGSFGAELHNETGVPVVVSPDATYLAQDGSFGGGPAEAGTVQSAAPPRPAGEYTNGRWELIDADGVHPGYDVHADFDNARAAAHERAGGTGEYAPRKVRLSDTDGHQPLTRVDADNPYGGDHAAGLAEGVTQRGAAAAPERTGPTGAQEGRPDSGESGGPESSGAETGRRESAADAADRWRQRYEADRQARLELVRDTVEARPEVVELRQEQAEHQQTERELRGEAADRRADEADLRERAVEQRQQARQHAADARTHEADDPRRAELRERAEQASRDAQDLTAEADRARTDADRLERAADQAATRAEGVEARIDRITETAIAADEQLDRFANDAGEQGQPIDPQQGPQDSQLTGSDEPPSVRATRPYGRPDEVGGVGYKPPSETEQRALEEALRNAYGEIGRAPEPQSGWLRRLLGPGDGNCVDRWLSLFDTYLHGRPTMAAEPVYTGYRGGEPRPVPHGDLRSRIDRATGGRFQTLFHRDAVPARDAAGRPAVPELRADQAFARLEEQLRAAGHGSIAAIGAEWRDGGDHVYAAVNHVGEILYADLNTGDWWRVARFDTMTGAERWVDATSGRETGLGAGDGDARVYVNVATGEWRYDPIYRLDEFRTVEATVISGDTGRPVPFHDVTMRDPGTATADYLPHLPEAERGTAGAESYQRELGDVRAREDAARQEAAHHAGLARQHAEQAHEHELAAARHRRAVDVQQQRHDDARARADWHAAQARRHEADINRLTGATDRRSASELASHQRAAEQERAAATQARRSAAGHQGARVRAEHRLAEAERLASAARGHAEDAIRAHADAERAAA